MLMQRCKNWLHCNKRIALNGYLYYVFSKLDVEFQPVINARNLCCHNWFVSNVIMSLLHASILTSFSLPDRSRQLFGPCLFSSAFQHALVLVINIGEDRFFCQFSCSLSVQCRLWFWSKWILNFLLLPSCYYDADRSPQLTGARFLLLSPCCCRLFRPRCPPHLFHWQEKMDTEIDQQEETSFSNTETNGIKHLSTVGNVKVCRCMNSFWELSLHQTCLLWYVIKWFHLKHC